MEPIHCKKCNSVDINFEKCFKCNNRYCNECDLFELAYTADSILSMCGMFCKECLINMELSPEEKLQYYPYLNLTKWFKGELTKNQIMNAYNNNIRYYANHVIGIDNITLPTNATLMNIIIDIIIANYKY